MMRHLFSLALIVVVSDASLQAEDFRLRDETTTRHTLRFSGSGDRSLTVRNVNGSIRVTSSSSASVEIVVRRVVRADTRDDLRRGADETTLSTADERPNVEAVVHDPRGYSCGEQRSVSERRRPQYSVEYDFTVSVPAGTRLNVCTINGGIEVVGTSGDFDVDNVNGRIKMTEVRGSGSATTVNGAVQASFLDVPRQNSTFTTVNGGVTVTWPDSLSADLRLKTLNGGLFTDFDVQSLPAAPAVAPSRNNGRFVYRSNNSANVRVGQGGPQVTLESVNGDIRVLRASH